MEEALPVVAPCCGAGASTETRTEKTTTTTTTTTIMTENDPPPSSPSSSPIDLMELVEGIKKCLRQKEVHLSKRVELQQLLRRFDTTLGELDRYAHFDVDKKYTRNLIATDNETFTLMLLCWTPGKESPIHDHPCDGCWVKVCSGTVSETRYQMDKENNKLLQDGEPVYASNNEVMYIDDGMGLHKVGNPSTDVLATTLHLYSPPFRTCSVWCSDESPLDKFMKPVVTYHSEFGELVDYTRVCDTLASSSSLGGKKDVHGAP